MLGPHDVAFVSGLVFLQKTLWIPWVPWSAWFQACFSTCLPLVFQYTLDALSAFDRMISHLSPTCLPVPGFSVRVISHWSPTYLNLSPSTLCSSLHDFHLFPMGRFALSAVPPPHQPPSTNHRLQPLQTSDSLPAWCCACLPHALVSSIFYFVFPTFLVTCGWLVSDFASGWQQEFQISNYWASDSGTAILRKANNLATCRKSAWVCRRHSHFALSAVPPPPPPRQPPPSTFPGSDFKYREIDWSTNKLFVVNASINFPISWQWRSHKGFRHRLHKRAPGKGCQEQSIKKLQAKVCRYLW